VRGLSWTEEVEPRSREEHEAVLEVRGSLCVLRDWVVGFSLEAEGADGGADGVGAVAQAGFFVFV